MATKTLMLARQVSRLGARKCAILPSRPTFTSSKLRPFSTSTAAWKKLYTKDHEWIELDTDGVTGTMGVSAYAAKELGDVIYVEIPEVGTELSQGDTLGAIESVKSASDLLTPVSGTVIEGNSVLDTEPGLVNKSAESEGWICKFKVTKPEELSELMDAEAYAEHTGQN